MKSDASRKRCGWCGDSCPRWGADTCPFRPRQLPREADGKRFDAPETAAIEAKHAPWDDALRRIRDDEAREARARADAAERFRAEGSKP